ncbi:MAG: hypothetical protein K5874_08240 [Bacteroidaceae bacterium]|nr:hypothetical protein [Bacteroidaceae bacterium]
MLYLLLAILCGTTCNVLFKVFNKYNLDIKQIVLFNYIAAVLINWIPISYNAVMKSEVGWDAYVLSPMVYFLSLIVGAFFMIAFVMMGKSVSLNGVALTTVAAKASLVLPVVLSWVFLAQPAPAIIPISLILLALVCIVMPISTKGHGKKSKYAPISSKMSIYSIVGLMGVFFFYGICDFSLKLLQHTVSEQCQDSSLVGFKLNALTGNIFLMAMLLSLLICVVSGSFKKHRLGWRVVVGGGLLGILNAGCTAFILRGLLDLSTGVLYPMYHTSVVLLSTLVGVLFFSERLRLLQVLGLIFAATAFVLLFQFS